MKTCIETLVKNEQLYIKEWVDYHLALGFDDIFIFEDKGSKPHDYLFEGYDNVHIRRAEDTGVGGYNTCKCLSKLMNYFLAKLAKEGEYDWCLLTDIDEFLVFEEGYDLKKLCEEFKDYSGILLPWKMYNANGHIKRPEGKVMDNYTNVIDTDVDSIKWVKKSFVNVRKGERMENNHHIKNGVDAEFKKGTENPKIFKKAWLNHYFTKSWEDFKERMLIRGNMGNDFRNFDNFFDQNPELKDMEENLLKEVRFKRTNNVHYISRKKRLISGGNIEIINKLK